METLSIREPLIGVAILLKAFEKNILYPKIGSTKTLTWGNLGMIEKREKYQWTQRTEICAYFTEHQVRVM